LKFTPAAGGTNSYGAVNALNQYPTVTPAGSSVQTIAYGNNGNLTGDGTWTFVYDSENRLMTANATGTAAAYAYDPLGRRTKKTVNSASTFFLQDGDDEVGEYTAAGAIQRRFVPGDTIDEPISMIDYTIAGNPKTYFHTDKQGSTIAMTDASGNLAEGPYKYDGYGNGAPTTGVPFKFTGRRLDPETGLYYYRARYYSASLGRFLQTDPMGYIDDLVSYKYVSNDPINLFDPTGEAFCDEHFNCYPSDTETVTVTADAEGPGASSPEEPLGDLDVVMPAFIISDLIDHYESPLSTNQKIGVELAMALVPGPDELRVGSKGIKITVRGLKHVLERHVPGGIRTAGKSLFNKGENVEALVKAAEGVAPKLQSGGNFERIVDAGRMVGTDRATGTPTSIYTVITNNFGDLVTAFPGRP
jgi:RHS repeat-associated protein